MLLFSGGGGMKTRLHGRFNQAATFSVVLFFCQFFFNSNESFSYEVKTPVTNPMYERGLNRTTTWSIQVAL